MTTDHEMRMEALRLYEENELLKSLARSQMAVILGTIGGTVDGHPTSEVNFLRRLRELVEIENQFRSTAR